MMNSDPKVGTILTFALGVGAGAVAALLLAPKSGSQLRRDISDGMSDAGQQIGNKGKQLKQRAQKAVDQAQGEIQAAVQAGQNAFTEAKNA